MQSHGDLTAVMCMNDGMATGIIQSVKAKGLLGEGSRSGIDAITNAITSIREGELDATYFRDSAGQGKGSANPAMKPVNGETVKA